MHLKHALRQLQISRLNASLGTTSGTTLSSLPDDILLMILDIVQANSERRPHGTLSYTCRRSSRHELDLLHLSMVNWHFRALAVLRLIPEITIGHEYRRWTGYELMTALEHLRGSLPSQHMVEVDLHITGLQTWNKKEYGTDYTNRGMFDYASEAYYTVSEELYRQFLATLPGGIRRRQTQQLERLGHLTAQVLSSMPKLRSMSLAMEMSDISSFCKAMEDSSPNLQTVTALKITPDLDYLIRLCPNLNTMDVRNWNWSGVDICALDQWPEPYIERWLATPTMRGTNLQHFSLRTSWIANLLRTVVETMPLLRSLNMYADNYQEEISVFLRLLCQLRGLTSLSLISSRMLPGYIPPVMEATMDCVSHMPHYGCHKPQAAMVMVFKALPELRELMLGNNFRARLETSSGGRDTAHWELGTKDREGKWLPDVLRRGPHWIGYENSTALLRGFYTLTTS